MTFVKIDARLLPKSPPQVLLPQLVLLASLGIWGDVGMAPLILDLSSRFEWPASRLGHITLWEIVPGTHCVGGGWVGPLRQSGHFGGEKNLLSLPGIKPRFLGRPARGLVCIQTELARLLWICLLVVSENSLSFYLPATSLQCSTKTRSF
jgi:hypothetical protein